MSTIALVGLDTLGASLGLALRGVGHAVVGHDRDPDRVRRATRLGAVARGEWNVLRAVEQAEVVFLCEPLDDLRSTLETIAPVLRPGSLTSDTLPLKGPVLEWASEQLPESVSFVGGHPVLDMSLEAQPSAGLLRGIDYCLAPLPGASDVAVRGLAGLVEMLGARPYFIDPQEHDALVAGGVLLPQLLSSAVQALAGRSPSADDMRRVAAPTLARYGVLDQVNANTLAESLVASRSHVVTWLDQALDELASARRALLEGDSDALDALLESAVQAQDKWSRPGPDLGALPDVDEVRRSTSLMQMLFGRLGQRPTRRD
jgi:prephenate dehydrogenase